jgi:TonB-dependent Receptor Plug Domain
MGPSRRLRLAVILSLLAIGRLASAQSGGEVRGRVTDATGGAWPGVTVELRGPAGTPLAVVSNDETMHLSLNADVVVIGKRTFVNLADVDNSAEDLGGIAESASQGAITGRQLDVRPFMRQAEVLETVPGVIITQHSGEGKANQYFLRGFNLDHGRDFAMSVSGVPVNMVTHAHSQGYSDLNFLIPELVAGVQYSKGPYFADQGDFATAGSSNMNYASELDRAIAHLETGTYGYARGLFAASPQVGGGHLLMAFETSKNNGPWDNPDAFEKLNGVVRYTRGDNVNGFSVTGMAYHGKWNATQAVPRQLRRHDAPERRGGISADETAARQPRDLQPGERRRQRHRLLLRLAPAGRAPGRRRRRPDASRGAANAPCQLRDRVLTPVTAAAARRTA